MKEGCVFSRLAAVRCLMKDIYYDLKSTKWKEALEGKAMQMRMADLCDLMSSLTSTALLRLMLHSKDPWLWLAGAGFIGLEPVRHGEIFKALHDELIDLESYTDHASFLHFFQALMHSRQFMTIYKNKRRTELRVENSLCQYMQQLNAMHAKLMVIRLDLSYGKIYASQMEPERRVLSDWEGFLEYVQLRFSSSFLGYAAKFEYGQEKGIHIHTLIFFNGSVVRRDAVIARHLGEVWVRSITQNAGMYFNANGIGYKARMKRCAVGVFGRNDEGFLLGSKDIARYFAKRDPIAVMAIPQMERTLRRSKISKQDRATMPTPDKVDNLSALASASSG